MSSAIRILIVDDDAVFNASLTRALSRRGYLAEGFVRPADALAAASRSEFAWAILDLNLGGENGLNYIRPLLELLPGCRILVLTGYASIATAVDAVKLGAYQYLAKPADVDSILAILMRDGSVQEENLKLELMSVDRLEWEHIQRVLHEQGGNISATARALKMHRRTLQRKLTKRPVSR